MDLKRGHSPREEGELEDGEICDDEPEVSLPIRRGDGNRPGRGARLRARKPPQHSHNMPHMGHQPSDFRHMQYNRPRGRGPFPPAPRQQCGPRGTDRPPAPPPCPLLPLPPSVPAAMPGFPHGDPCPRTSGFWERSHNALGRFRHRTLPNSGQANWNRGLRSGGDIRVPPGRYGPGEIQGTRKQKPQVRNQFRKGAHCVSKQDNSVEESFEDLLSKYKQIQLELECIRKEETMALEPKVSPSIDQIPAHPASVPDNKQVQVAVPLPEESLQAEVIEKKVFQAFNIRPLRQRLPVSPHLAEKCDDQEDKGSPAEMEVDEESKSKEGAEVEGADKELDERKTCPLCAEGAKKDEKATKACSCQSDSSASSEDSAISSDKPPVALKEEEELSELQLRLLALQSASKKWQQKEQQVMKRSKDRITKVTQEKNSSPPAAAPGRRVTTRSISSSSSTTTSTPAAERSRTRSKTLDRDRTKPSIRPSDRERPKGSSKGLQERSRAPGKSHLLRKFLPGSAAKQVVRKQHLRTWKLQQQREEQREQEEIRRQEEEERRKREEEIRRIRDLSNQDEQYNRFMKLVGGKMRTRSRSTEREHRKSTGKPCLDASGNLYQYDNYDEVAMDTDSEAGSPVPSPTHTQLHADHAGCLPGQFAMDFSQPFLSTFSTGPPPPPPLPPPADLLEAPPKPPFADEEEEEEMLLRETCLMSMVNKRVAVTEEQSCSAPGSPSSQPPTAAQPPARGNLSTVSLNTVSHSRTNKFGGHQRAPLVLPIHKAVVVSLKDSDDSDSDVDNGSSTPMGFGGLEFMIKEARRTAEAAKPKAASASEKENNPVRTPEALPEDKKVEYRLLREQIASREKQKMLREHSVSTNLNADSESLLGASGKLEAELKLSEAKQRLDKHRELLQRDEAILQQLLQQEIKKKESLKAAEVKVTKLREQLLASERIVGANKTLLRKLQEQVQRVEHRVTVKKSLAVRFEQELSHAQLVANRVNKRKINSGQMLATKRQRVANLKSEKYFEELMVQKQRLQQLESEYALKIQKLKEAQALRNKGVQLDLPTEPSVRTAASPEREPRAQIPACSPHFPQPSLHDLTLDKLNLESDDVSEADEHETEAAPAAPAPAPAAPAAAGGRRHSFRQSSCSFTKPHLEQQSLAPAKDSGPNKTSKLSASPESSAEMFTKLDVDALKKRYQQLPPLTEVLHGEWNRVVLEVERLPVGELLPLEVDTNQSGNFMLKPVPFSPYHSPLLTFKSYRFSTYYRTKEKLSLRSVTYSNTIDPMKCFCRFDLTGTCNDDDCRWQHMRNCTMIGNQLFQDILSYSLPLIGCPESSSDEDIHVATEKYMKKLFGTSKDQMGVDQKAVLLVSKVNESKRHVPPYTTCKGQRKWRPRPSVPSSFVPEEDNKDESASGNVGLDDCSRPSLPALDVCVTSDDKRYFVSETDDISNLEASVLESPQDTQLWIKLAFKYLSQNETSAAECLEAALNTLSRALETNCDDPEVWSHYLSLFSRRGSKEEVQEMCEMAVEHAANYRVWWNYLNLESSFDGKDDVCERLLQFLLSDASSAASDKHSFQLMEALLYRVHLNLFTGRLEAALTILQNALKSASDRSLAEHLTASDRALLWLSYIHLSEFEQLPRSLYNPAESGPSRLVSREPFLLPWRTAQDISTPPHTLVALFEDAVSQCSDEAASPSERIRACLPLHTNLILLFRLLERFDEGVALCESLLELCPESCTLRDALADLHIRNANGEQAVSMWLHALAECPNNAEVFYHCCTFLMAQGKSSAIPPLFRGFILSLCEDQKSQKRPIDVLRHILGFPSEELLSGGVMQDLHDQLSQQMAYLHLIHCRWQWLHGSVEETVDAFERALGSSVQLQELCRLWTDYLLFSCSHQERSHYKLISDLVWRCLSTVPSRLELPFNPSEFWSCYGFHNQARLHVCVCVCVCVCTGASYQGWRFHTGLTACVCLRLWEKCICSAGCGPLPELSAALPTWSRPGAAAARHAQQYRPGPEVAAPGVAGWERRAAEVPGQDAEQQRPQVSVLLEHSDRRGARAEGAVGGATSLPTGSPQPPAVRRPVETSPAV
ncbi:zinc finger C3H1 domain-containing protein-like isoform X2 [Takifugu flavidus]|uniref:zinc finger C3H1 domain-containing protein-like isoform X2 n=1 Tax=Takifugu flavidus TaxID=433684 RepID=UPI0025445E4D|nr:zinc finger C3H1 domain-containing protein-like isoform X2 [Takifugu flavidus]